MTRQFLSEVVAIEPVMDDSMLLTLGAPAGMAGQVRAGQFLSILCRPEGSFDPLLRRQYAVFSADPRMETLTLLVRPSGRAGAWLARQTSGTVLDVLGPIGNAFTLSARTRNVLLVAGGVGAAPLVLLASEAIATQRSVTFLMGAATAGGLLPPALLPGAVEYVVATVDGSRGHQGVVTDLAPAYLGWADQIFTCGPEPMFHSLRAIIQAHGIGGTSRVQVAIERSMACGMGVCLGCVVDTRHGLKASCTVGPVFEMDEVVW